MSSNDTRSKIFLQVVSEGLDQAYRKRSAPPAAGPGRAVGRPASSIWPTSAQPGLGIWP